MMLGQFWLSMRTSFVAVTKPFPELLADVGSGHNIRATCYEQAREMITPAGRTSFAGNEWVIQVAKS